jgi:hypothetical protein
MRNWNDLSLIQKLLIGLFIVFAAFAGPEMMFLIDIGGLELAFGALAVYFKPTIDWLQLKINWLYSQIQIIKIGFLNSAIFQPRVFTTHAVFCSVAMILTGSLVLSVGFFLPALLANGMLV